MATAHVKLRSPRYPIIGLRDAIEKAISVYKSDYRNKIPKSLIATHMGYTSLNGKSLGVISAVAKYGLIEGSRDAMWVTDRTVDIAEREVNDPERIQAIKDAADSPEPFRDIDQNFSGRTSDAAIRSFLITKRQYLPESAERLIKAYRETKDLLENLSIEQPSQHREEPAPHVDLNETTAAPAFQQSKLAVDGRAVITSEHHASNAGEREWIRGPLSRDTSYRLIVSGSFGPKEIGKLIKLLQAQKSVLSDDEDEEYNQ